MFQRLRHGESLLFYSWEEEKEQREKNGKEKGGNEEMTVGRHERFIRGHTAAVSLLIILALDWMETEIKILYRQWKLGDVMVCDTTAAMSQREIARSSSILKGCMSTWTRQTAQGILSFRIELENLKSKKRSRMIRYFSFFWEGWD